MAFTEQAFLIRNVTLSTTRSGGRKKFAGSDLPRVLRKFGKELKKHGSPVGSVVLSISEMVGPEDDKTPRKQTRYAVISDTDGDLYFTLQVRTGDDVK